MDACQGLSQALLCAGKALTLLILDYGILRVDQAEKARSPMVLFERDE